MAIPHARPGETIDVRPLGEQLPAIPTHAILKTNALELMRVVLKAGDVQPRRSAHGEVTIQCIEGSVLVDTEDGSIPLDAGRLMLLQAEAPHALRAIVDSSLLVTMQTPPDRPGSASSTTG